MEKSSSARDEVRRGRGEIEQGSYLETTGAAMEWEDFKNEVTGRSGKASDDVLIAHCSRHGQSARPRQSSAPDAL
jgi:hypothetical protein